MSHTKKFWINNVNDHGGPNLFSTRLKNELQSRGFEYLSFPAQPTNLDGAEKRFVNLCAIAGPHWSNAYNVLRLDNLYFDSEDPRCDRLNQPIFDCYNRFDHVVFQSEFSKKMYESFTGIKKDNSVILNGVTDFFKHDPEVERPEILKRFRKVCITSAAWRRHKRLEELINVFKRPELYDVALVVLGGAEYEGINPSDCPPNVFLHRKVHHTNLPAYYNIADAMLFISWLDCCPNAVVESLACGIPVLCSHNG